MRKREKECFRCGGRGRLSDRKDEICFVCHGKGHIEIDPVLLEEYWARFRGKFRGNIKE